jgi:hypothetical protein
MHIDNQAGISDGQAKSLVRDVARMAGENPHYVCIRQVTPFDMTVALWEELAAYKLAYAYREHAQSRVTVERATGPAMPGAFLVVMTPR